MIYAVRADHPTFRSINFTNGFNVILATRTATATDRDSRNGAGKTTFIEIVHFCLGGKASKKNRLLVPQLRDWTFSLDLDLRGKPYRISRATSDPKKIFVEGDFTTWPVKPKRDRNTDRFTLSVPVWNDLLGWLMFDLPLHGTDELYEPSFRSLFSYFVRRTHDAFSNPFEHHRKQQEWDKQVNNAFFLGLSWDYPAKLQKLRDQEKTINQLRAAIKLGAFPDLLGTVGELESQKILLDEQIARRTEELRTFRVHPQYQEYQERANALQTKVRQLNQENATDSAMLAFYQESVIQEGRPDANKLAQIYQEAGVSWPQGVRKRIEDVQEFHEKIVINRRAFLENEISRLTLSISRRSEEIQKLSNERANVLVVLDTHGALAEYSQLQRLQNEDIARMNAIRQKIENLRRIEEIKSQTRIEREQLQIMARSMYEEKHAERERAVSLFNEFSQQLYRQPGELVVDVSENGYKFNVEIQRQDSQGVQQMKVFLYDLTISVLMSQKHSGPGFLIHDSTIFADVDERQKAHAFELAARMAEQFGFQYICCLNSDAIPSADFDSKFSLDPFIRIELTDEGEKGGLLGIRY